MDWLIWFVLAMAIYNVFMGLVMNTKDIKSGVVFKFIPLILGMATMIYFLKVVEVI